MKGLIVLRQDIAELFALVTLTVGCAVTTAPVPPFQFPPEVMPHNYQFSYTPAKEAGSVSTTIGLISPEFTISITGDEAAFDFKPIQEIYTTALQTDFNATLVAKGYGVAGSYASIANMTFGEKRTANVVLVSKVILNVRSLNGEAVKFSSRDVETNKTLGDDTVYREDAFFEIPGAFTTSGFIELTMYEPLSSQKVWVKKIGVPFEQTTYKFYVLRSREYYYERAVDILAGRITVISKQQEAPAKYDGRLDALAKALEKAYSAQLDQFAHYFDPREIAYVFKDAEEARQRARF